MFRWTLLAGRERPVLFGEREVPGYVLLSQRQALVRCFFAVIKRRRDARAIIIVVVVGCSGVVTWGLASSWKDCFV